MISPLTGPLVEYISIIVYVIMGYVAAVTMLSNLSWHGSNPLDAFPTAGTSTWLGFWWTVFKFWTNAQGVIQDGYKKYKHVPFKIPGFSHWTVILSDRAHLEEVARASDDELSLIEAMNDQFQFEHMLGPLFTYNSHQIAVLLPRLTRKFEVLYPSIREEIIVSCADALDLRGSEWKSVPALGAIRRIVCRTSNRAIVGLPLCRNAEWLDLNIRYAVNVILGGIILRLFPRFMRPPVAYLLTKAHRGLRRSTRILGPLIEERRKYLDEYGKEWAGDSGDLLLLLAEGPALTQEALALRVLLVNLATVYATSNSFTQALFHLARNPQYIQPLREEVEGVVGKNGWTKAALGEMNKIDSFLKECQRMEGIDIVTLGRKALKDFTFSDGTLIPRGTIVAAAAHALHHDDSLYGEPNMFKPFRFAELREGGKAEKYQLASATTEFLPFGLGKHACSGRFVATSMMKSLLAHIVVTYDVKLEDDAAFPRNLHIGTSIATNPHARVMFRNRLD